MVILGILGESEFGFGENVVVEGIVLLFLGCVFLLMLVCGELEVIVEIGEMYLCWWLDSIWCEGGV